MRAQRRRETKGKESQCIPGGREKPLFFGKSKRKGGRTQDETKCPAARQGQEEREKHETEE